MNNPTEYGSLFQAPQSPDAHEPPPPTVDGSDEAMHRLRHPFDIPPQASDRGQRSH